MLTKQDACYYLLHDVIGTTKDVSIHHDFFIFKPQTNRTITYDYQKGETAKISSNKRGSIHVFKRIQFNNKGEKVLEGHIYMSKIEDYILTIRAYKSVDGIVVDGNVDGLHLYLRDDIPKETLSLFRLCVEHFLTTYNLRLKTVVSRLSCTYPSILKPALEPLNLYLRGGET